MINNENIIDKVFAKNLKKEHEKIKEGFKTSFILDKITTIRSVDKSEQTIKWKTIIPDIPTKETKDYPQEALDELNLIVGIELSLEMNHKVIYDISKKAKLSDDSLDNNLKNDKFTCVITSPEELNKIPLTANTNNFTSSLCVSSAGKHNHLEVIIDPLLPRKLFIFGNPNGYVCRIASIFEPAAKAELLQSGYNCFTINGNFEQEMTNNDLFCKVAL